MADLGALYYAMHLKDLTDADFKRINSKLKNLGAEVQITPKILKDMAQLNVPKGVKIELDPKITNEALARAVEGKVMKVEVTPLITQLRKALKEATSAAPPEIEVGVNSGLLRSTIERILKLQGFRINVIGVDGNYDKAVQQRLNGTRYKVKIHADAKEITQSVQASLMQVQSRTFGLKVTKDVLYKSIDEALSGHKFPISVYVKTENARNAVQTALNKAAGMSKDDILNHNRLMKAEAAAAAAELNRVKAANYGAADAARTHASASINLGGAMGGNIKIAGELGSAMASLYSIHAAKEFLSQVVEIGGELEHQKIAMNTIFGDTGKQMELFGQIKSLARQSPFGVMELTASVKSLSAYGVQYNEIYDTAKRLADISAATSVDINRLILAFGKTKSRTFLDGLEAKQFAYANIPIYEMLSKKLTELEGKFVSVKEVMGRIKKREIGFDMVKDVLWDLTDEGGKFYNMQEALAGSVKTSWKLVRDNIELMFGEIAEGSVGAGLKDVAEILQKLTREWRTIGAIVSGGAAAFGIYKVAVLASNTAMGQATAANIRQRLSQEALNASRAKSAMAYRALSAEETLNIQRKSALEKVLSNNILKTNALTSAEIELLVSSKALTRDSAARLIALGKITPMQARYLVQQKLITLADLSAAITARKHGVSINVLGKEVKIASFRFKMLGIAIGNALKSLGAMLIHPATLAMAALGAIASISQRHSEAMDRAKEANDQLFTRASEGATNLQKTLDGLKPSTGLSELELTQGIEQMENAIKDYSPTPFLAINEALVTQDGHVKTLAERYDSLRRKVEGIKTAFDEIQDNKVNKAIETALGDTKENWFTDGLEQNLKDYDNAIAILRRHTREYASKHKDELKGIVEEAAHDSYEYRMAIKSMTTDEQKFQELVRHGGRYGQTLKPGLNRKIADAAEGGLFQNMVENVSNIDLLSTRGRVDDSYENAMKDIEKFAELFKAEMALKGLDISQMSKETLSIALNSAISGLQISEESRMLLSKEMEKAFDVTLIDDKVTPILTDAFKKMVSESNSEAVKEAMLVWQTKGWKELSSTQMQLMSDLYSQAQIKARDSIEGIVGDMNDYLLAHPGQYNIVINAVGSELAAKQQDLTQSIIVKQQGKNIALTPQINDQLNAWAAKGEGKVYETRNAAQQDLQNAQNELEAAKTLGEASEQYINAKAVYEKVWNAIVYAGWEDLRTTDQKSNKHDKEKDELAESLKQRFKDIKDAWSEFQKWSKTEGRDAAATRIGESGLFSTLSADQIPKTIEDYRDLVKSLEDELRKAGVKGAARESLLNDLLKQLLDIDKTVVDEQLKLALDKVSKEAERQIADWNLFDKIRKATGNQNLAMSIAFGMNATAETDYPAMIKKQFADLAETLGHDLTFDNTTLEQARDLGDEIAKSYQDTASKLEKYARDQKDAIADILNEYQSLSDKLAKIDADRDRKIDVVNKSDMREPEKAVLRQRINVEADYQKFQQSADYLKFFSGIYSLTMDKAQEIGDKIRLHLDQRLQAGKISAEDYYKEIERINQQLSKLRNVRSDTLTFATSGAKGLQNKQLEKADSNLLAQITKVEEAEENLIKARSEGNKEEIESAELSLRLAKESLDYYRAVRDAIVKDMESWQKVADVANIASNIAGGVSDAFNSIKDMADSFGFDTESNDWLNVGGVVDTLSSVTGGISKAIQSAMSGDIGGILSGAVSTITSPFTIWSKLHDKKLQKMIDRSKQAAQIMQNQYDILEKQMANFLGNAAGMNTGVLGGGYGKQRELMQGQLAELEKQRRAELDKKKTDNSVVEDYNKQIEEMKISIRDFAIEAANSLYGIDLNGWAQQLGDSLVDAFAAGEDAAEAFDNTVGDIMKDVTKKMISQDILAPMFGDLRDFLFGADGKSGAFGADFKLDPSELGAMKEYLDKIKNEGIPAAQELFDAINESTGGMLNDTEKSKSGLSAGIQGIREDTADLLASYVNGIRADVSVSRLNWDKLLESALPQMNVIAEAQLTAQRQIAENTLRTAEAAEAINSAMSLVTKNQDRLERSWRRIAEKNWGTY